MTMLRIAVADDEPDMREYFEKILPRLGHQVTSVAENGRELVEHCRSLKPDLVITDIKMPEMDGIAAATIIYRESPIPVILVSAYYDQELIDRAEANHVLAYLVKPIEQKDLAPAIALARSRFQQFQALRQEAADLRQALEDRKIVERAKGIMMRRARLDEYQAFNRLQHLSREQNRKLIEIARAIVIAEQAFQPADAVSNS
jgi:response regulator NasT